uniref:Lipocalin/cytosolic fatty-acid binding domain-containing protein n=2 Tax=Lutzomyia longipalpis TaxID=7200 RepID=A0A1B0CQ42_LUTLO
MFSTHLFISHISGESHTTSLSVCLDKMGDMVKSFVRALILLCSLSAVWGIWVVPGQCPTDRPVEKNFNITKYAGLWYEYLRPDDNYAFLGDCNTIFYTAHPNGISISISSSIYSSFFECVFTLQKFLLKTVF